MSREIGEFHIGDLVSSGKGKNDIGIISSKPEGHNYIVQNKYNYGLRYQIIWLTSEIFSEGKICNMMNAGKLVLLSSVD